MSDRTSSGKSEFQNYWENAIKEAVEDRKENAKRKLKHNIRGYYKTNKRSDGLSSTSDSVERKPVEGSLSPDSEEKYSLQDDMSIASSSTGCDEEELLTDTEYEDNDVNASPEEDHGKMDIESSIGVRERNRKGRQELSKDIDDKSYSQRSRDIARKNKLRSMMDIKSKKWSTKILSGRRKLSKAKRLTKNKKKEELEYRRNRKRTVKSKSTRRRRSKNSADARKAKSEEDLKLENSRQRRKKRQPTEEDKKSQKKSSFWSSFVSPKKAKEEPKNKPEELKDDRSLENTRHMNLKMFAGNASGNMPDCLMCRQREHAKPANRSHKRKRKIAPFIKFYLTVYEELGGRCSVRSIAKEAAKRWGKMSSQEKLPYYPKSRR